MWGTALATRVTGLAWAGVDVGKTVVHHTAPRGEGLLEFRSRREGKRSEKVEKQY